MKIHARFLVSVSALLLIELVVIFFFVRFGNKEKMERSTLISNKERHQYIQKRETNISFFDFNDYTTAQTINNKAEEKTSNYEIKPIVPKAAYNKNTSSGQKSICKFLFDAKEMKDVKRDLLQKQKEAAYLFYLKITTSSNIHLTSDISEELLEWQIIDKSQKILGKLPVDFDIISLFLFEIDKEETQIQLNLYLNDSRCTFDKQTAIREIQFLLWSELLTNDTNHYLCRRKIELNMIREILYVITTIWLGYDLWCSFAPYDDNNSYVILDKNMFYVSSVLCYLLSLQFVWIFTVLDVKYVKISEATGDEKIVPITSSKYKGDHPLFSYRKFDRPSGLQRCILKSFFSQCTGCCRCCNSCRPESRLSIIFAILIICIGLYCTIFRFYHFYSIHQQNPFFVRASEPLNTWFFKVDIVFGFVLDILYCLISPILFAIFVPRLYRSYTNDNFNICASTKESDNRNDFTIYEGEYKGLSNRFIGRWDKMSRMCYSCCSKPSCDSLNPKCCCEFCAHLCLSFFPVFPFIHYHFISKSNDNEKEGTKMQKKSSLNGESSDGIEIKPLAKPVEQIQGRATVGTQVPNQNTSNVSGSEEETSENKKKIVHEQNKVQQREETVGQDNQSNCKNKCLRGLLISLSWIAAYLVVRPILSYVTFIFRVLTYFMFVTLPIRLNLFRYTLIVSTTIIYILKYLVNIVNLKSEILQYLFELQSEQRPTPDNTQEYDAHITEELYDEVSRELIFVRRGMHLFLMKSFIAIICCIFLFEVFLDTGISMSAVHTKEIIELALVLIGPYAISAFLKGSKENYLTEMQKQEIKIAYEKYLRKNHKPANAVNTEEKICQSEGAAQQLKEHHRKNPSHKPTNSKQKAEGDEQKPLVKNDQLDDSSTTYGATSQNA